MSRMKLNEINGLYKTATILGPSPEQIAGYNKHAYRKLIKQITYILLELNGRNGLTSIITDGEPGICMGIVKIIANTRHKHAKLAAVLQLPFFMQDAAYPETGLFSKKYYKDILFLANNITFETNASAETVKKYRDELIANNQIEMINMSDLVIVLANEDPELAAKDHMTNQSLQFAIMRKKDILRLRFKKPTDPRQKIELTGWETLTRKP